MTSTKLLHVGRVHLQGSTSASRPACPAWPVGILPQGRRSWLKQVHQASTGTQPLPQLSQPVSRAPVGACPPLKDPDSQGKRKMLFKTSLCCVLFVCNCSAMQCPSLACAQTRVRHTRTLLNSSTTQTASCNLSSHTNTADAALEFWVQRSL